MLLSKKFLMKSKNRMMNPPVGVSPVGTKASEDEFHNSLQVAKEKKMLRSP